MLNLNLIKEEYPDNDYQGYFVFDADNIVDKNFIKKFDYIGECAEYMRENFNVKAKVDTIRSGILNSIKEELVYLKKEELKDQIKLYNSINKNGNSSYSFEKIKELKQQMDNMTIKNTTFTNEEMQGYVDDYLQKDLVNHIEKLNIIPTLAYESTIIGNMNDNNPLTMVYSFSYIPKSFEMKFPKMKGNSYLFTSKDIDMIQTELLISNKMFNKRRVLYSTEFSDLTFSYMLLYQIVVA